MRGLEGPNLRGGAEIYPKGSAAMKRLLIPDHSAQLRLAGQQPAQLPGR